MLYLKYTICSILDIYFHYRVKPNKGIAFYQFSNLAGAARWGATCCFLHWAKGRLSQCPWALGLCLGAHYQKGPPYCYARESEMARCSTKTMLARGPAGVTVRACLDFGPGPNSCCMPRAPIILNPALGIWYWPKFNVGPMLSQRWHDNVGTTLDQRWPNSGPTLAQRWPNSGPALAHMNVLKLWCDGRKDKLKENLFKKC